MSRTQTSNYQADAFTTFWWATNDNDQFDRELDMGFVAQALEYHNHSSGRGLPVTRVEANAIDATALASNAVTTAKIANLAVTGAKIAELTIGNTKLTGGISADKLVAGVAVASLGYTPLNLAGGTVTGTLEVSQAGLRVMHLTAQSTSGLYVEKNGGSGVCVHTHNKEASPGYSYGALNAAGNAWDLLASHAQWSFGNTVVLGSTSNHIQQMTYGNSAMIGNLNSQYLNGQAGGYYGRATHEAFSGAHVLVPTAGNIPAGWARNTNLDGRVLMGGGTTAGIGNNFAEGSHYGNWKPKADLSANNGLSVSQIPDASNNNFALAAGGGGGGSFNASQLNHFHNAPTLSGSISLNNTTTDWFIAAFTMVLCYKT